MGGAGSQLFVAQEYSLGDEVGKLNRNEEIRDAKAQKRSFVSYETPQSAEEMCLGSDISILMYTFVHPYSLLNKEQRYFAQSCANHLSYI